MPVLVAGILCLVALGASLLAGNDAMTCLTRGGIAFLSGFFIGQLWTAVFGTRTPVLSMAETSQPEEVKEAESKAA